MDNHVRLKTLAMNRTFSVLVMLAVACPDVFGQKQPRKRIVANPIELNYQFQPDSPSRREAADPTCILFNDSYYLFVSKSSGYWKSADLAKWTYIPCRSIATINDYAPAVLAYKGTLYYTASDRNRIFKNAHPDQDSWTEIPSKFQIPEHDPYLFQDDDGKVYYYWGCSDVDPIMGVEVDPEDGFAPKGKPVVLIRHHAKDYGWENPGENNEADKDGWNEGPAMFKYEGRYYLQYAAPGTQFRIYADGCYVGDSPLGPFTYIEDNPFSIKPGGFIAGAGHGDTFKDRYGNYWHVASMKISQRHWFERRIGLFPVTLTEHGPVAHTVFTDYPFVIPDRQTDFSKTAMPDGYNLLSYGKAIQASSALPEHGCSLANDERVETWWSASTGHQGEWLRTDLGSKMEIKAIQANFADDHFTVKAPAQPQPYRYRIEVSDDTERWTTIVDQSRNEEDLPHRLHLLDRSVHARYVRIVNQCDLNGNFSLYDFRIFGTGNGPLPSRVRDVRISRNQRDGRSCKLTWAPLQNATGYIVSWGTDPKRLTHSTMTFDPYLDANWYSRNATCYFYVKAFNENGVGE